MRTLYAIALICLSVPAFASEDFGGLSYDGTAETGYWYDAEADLFGDDNTATIITPAAPKTEDQSAAAMDTGYAYDADADFFGDDDIATITAPTTPNRGGPSVAAMEIGSLYDAGADFNFDDETTGRISAQAAPTNKLGLFTPEDWTYQGDTVDLNAFPADDWF
jgi:hypothetical protein